MKTNARYFNRSLKYSNSAYKYVILFVVLYLLVSVFEGSCAHPNLDSTFLFVTAPFNPLEDCALASIHGGILVEIASNFVFVAFLIYFAGYYFAYISRITRNRIKMSYVFASAIISTYIASAMSYLYFSKFVDIRLKVATGTSIIGFDMCLFIAVFMSIELYYNIKASSGNKNLTKRRLRNYMYAISIRIGFIAILLVIIYSYLNVSLVHLSGLTAIPIFAVLAISFGHTTVDKTLKLMRSNYRL